MDNPRSTSVGFSVNFLSHGPVTTSGTCLKGPNTDLEPLERYKEGGFHPIHLGDTLGPSGRYRVLRKLGHGGYGTVWLCRDTCDDSSRYVAIKVTVARVKPEAIPDLTIMADLDRSAPGAEHISFPLHTFSLKGPNGTHQCIVLPVYGPCVSPRIWTHLKEEPGPVLRGMAYQAAKAMNYLHMNGICHGDFRPANILVKLTNINHLPENNFLSIFDEPKLVEVLTESGDGLPLSSPRYLTYAIDLFRLGGEYLTDQICVVDFGEAFRVSTPPKFSCIPESYLSPELLLQMLQDEKNDYGADDEDGEEENDGDDTTNDDLEEGRVTIGPACDLWALGCTLYAIRQQMALFYMIDDPDELVAEMVRFFGKLPSQWWDTWDRRAEFYDDQGKWVRHGGNETYSLEFILSRPRTIVREPGHESQRTILMTPEAEQKLMADLLYKLLQYEPEKRISAKDVLAHEWFRM